MGITFGDYLIDSGYYDITPEQEREIEAREDRRLARMSRPQTPQEWLKKYDAILEEGRGLTAREWDHYGELERTVQRETSR